AAAVALGVIDAGHVVAQEDGLLRAVFDADAAADAAGLAGLDHRGAALLIAAEHRGLGRHRLHFQQAAGAGFGAGGAAGALGAVNNGHAVLHAERAEHTGFDAVAVAQAAVGAGGGAAGHAGRGGAALDAGIIKPDAAV